MITFAKESSLWSNMKVFQNIKNKFTYKQKVALLVLARAHFEAKYIFDKGASEAELKPIQALLRKNQWRWDYAITSHDTSSFLSH